VDALTNEDQRQIPVVPGAAVKSAAPTASGVRRRPRFAGLGALTRYLSPVVLIAVWQIACSTGLLSTRLMASPAQIIAEAWSLTLDGTLPTNLGVSLGRAGAGLAIAVIVGTSLALVAGLSQIGEEIIDAPLQIMRTLPALALVPLFILWFGIGETPKIIMVALGSSFPIYLNLHKGIRSIDAKLLEMARTLGLSRVQTIRDVILPGALPDFLVGLRFAVGISWLMLVVAEQVNADSGIGHMMIDAEDFMRTDIILVGLLVYGLLGLVPDQIVRLLESALLSWRTSNRPDRAR